jgi:hypothetical protein
VRPTINEGETHRDKEIRKETGRQRQRQREAERPRAKERATPFSPLYTHLEGRASMTNGGQSG